ncbi:hypothetical protein Staley_112 [Bacillus phage Staley]|uniref:Uncharacterized protein n=1 Tax=Bacillus phage Staley TaxID=1406792 RepID=U5PXQ9_9CAUD|nr:hypothetical protein Staley_112 [Bacillus phage Staley]AGY48795.1 hypothetical protein Staley_112 [Bacillus phage Staley]
MEKVLFENQYWTIEISGGDLFVSNKRLAGEWPGDEYALIEKFEDVETCEIKRVKIPKYIRQELKNMQKLSLLLKKLKKKLKILLFLSLLKKVTTTKIY